MLGWSWREAGGGRGVLGEVGAGAGGGQGGGVGQAGLDIL